MLNVEADAGVCCCAACWQWSGLVDEASPVFGRESGVIQGAACWVRDPRCWSSGSCWAPLRVVFVRWSLSEVLASRSLP